MRSAKHTIKWKWFIAICAIAFIFLTFALCREYVGNIQIQREINSLEQQKQEQEQVQLETINLIDQLSSEYYLEQEGRVKQGLGKEGETVVVIQDNLISDELLSDEGESDSGITNITRWFYYFFSRDVFEGLVDYENS